MVERNHKVIFEDREIGEVIGEENGGVGYRSITAERGCMVGALLEGVCVGMI